MNSRIVIAHLISPLALYGKEQWLIALLRYMDRERYDSMVIPLVGRSDTPLAQQLHRENICCHPVALRHCSVLSNLRQLHNLIEHAHVDILQSHDYRSDVFALMLKRRLHTTIISTPHGWSSDPDIKLRLYELMDTMLLRYFDRVIPVSPHTAQRLRWCRPDALRRIDNFLDVHSLPCVEAVDATLVSFVGRLVPLKRTIDCIDALSRVRDNRVRLQIIGDGPLRAKLEQRCRSLGIQDRVAFLGFRPDALELLARSALLIIPSLTEGISRVAMEAMALGKPIIGTDIPGINIIIKNSETGLLVPVKNPDAIAAAIESIIGDPAFAERLGKSARSYIAEHHSAESAARAYGALYEELVRGTPTS